MQNNKRSGFAGWMRDKGYYIVLVLCVAAVGISGYLYFTHNDTPQGDVAAAASMQDPAISENQAAYEEGNPEPDAATQTIALQMPLQGQVLNTFAPDHLTYNETMADWRVHNGVDLAAEAGTSVCAAADGVVSAVWEDDFLGHTVEITHDGGYTTRYCNLAPEILVQAGDSVVCGAVIGTVGSSAKLELEEQPHLHFEVFCGDELLNPETYWEE